MAEIGTSGGKTSRHGLPLLYPGQAHKEVAHNEALARIDLLMGAAVEDVADIPDSLTPQPGQSWLISATASGIWAERQGQIAAFLENDWIYLLPREGQLLYIIASQTRTVYRDGSWQDAEGFSAPQGGATVDSEARAAVVALSETLERLGFLQLG
ncbi:MAG: DUF2793 domain-containing protein [Pseudomonadota bacterium]